MPLLEVLQKLISEGPDALTDEDRSIIRTWKGLDITDINLTPSEKQYRDNLWVSMSPVLTRKIAQHAVAYLISMHDRI